MSMYINTTLYMYHMCHVPLQPSGFVICHNNNNYDTHTHPPHRIQHIQIQNNYNK